jgi:hypothetical protein
MWDFVMDKSSPEAGFLRELRFPLPIYEYIPSASPQSFSLSPEAGTIGQEWPQWQYPHKPNKKKVTYLYILKMESNFSSSVRCSSCRQFMMIRIVVQSSYPIQENNFLRHNLVQNKSEGKNKTKRWGKHRYRVQFYEYLRYLDVLEKMTNTKIRLSILGSDTVLVAVSDYSPLWSQELVKPSSRVTGDPTRLTCTVHVRLYISDYNKNVQKVFIYDILQILCQVRENCNHTSWTFSIKTDTRSLAKYFQRSMLNLWSSIETECDYVLH